MDGKELLALAAKAIGYELDEDGDRLDERTNSGAPKPWNPLEDDGDALRLAADLKLDVEFYEAPDGDWVSANNHTFERYLAEKDKYSATRRAIARAAAAIGEGVVTSNASLSGSDAAGDRSAAGDSCAGE